MKLITYRNYNTINFLPVINMTYENSLDKDLFYLSFEIGWLLWGISIVLIDR